MTREIVVPHWQIIAYSLLEKKNRNRTHVIFSKVYHNSQGKMEKSKWSMQVRFVFLSFFSFSLFKNIFIGWFCLNILIGQREKCIGGDKTFIVIFG